VTPAPPAEGPAKESSEPARGKERPAGAQPAEGAPAAAAPPDPAGRETAEKKFPDLAAIIETDRGAIKAELAVEVVPQLVAHFANLAERRFYDGLTFHAVSKGVQVHSGDPTGTGDGGCGIRLPKKFHKSMLFEKPGVLGLWSTTSQCSSQFFITLMPMANKYNLRQAGIGRVVEGLDVASRLVEGDRVKTVRIEGDQTKLREAFSSDLAAWNRALDAEARK
jgi:peptidyl-prolyl cis-trans isomerase B (cyclophilin B)